MDSDSAGDELLRIAAVADGSVAPADAEQPGRLARAGRDTGPPATRRRRHQLRRDAGPADLKARIEKDVARRDRRAKRRIELLGAIALALVTAAVFGVLAVSGGGALTVTDALTLANRPAAEQVGARIDRIDGRRVRTEYLRRGRHRLAYTVVSGPPIEPPLGARRSTLAGIEYRFLERRGRQAVTWIERGRTCLLSGRGVSRATLLDSAQWRRNRSETSR